MANLRKHYYLSGKWHAEKGVFYRLNTVANLTINIYPSDACTDNPCQNGATCESEDNTYLCRCAVGFDGPTCVNKGKLYQCMDKKSNSCACSKLISIINCRDFT